MKESNENIDKLFKDAFSTDQFPMDETMWADANAMIKASKPKYSRFGIVILAIVTIIGTSLYMLTGDTLNAKNKTYTQRTNSEESILNGGETTTNDNLFTKLVITQASPNTISESGSQNNLNALNSIISKIHSDKTTQPKTTLNNKKQPNVQNPTSSVSIASLVKNNSNLAASASTVKATNSNTRNVTNSGASYSTSSAMNKGFSGSNNKFFNQNNLNFHTPNEEFIHLTPQTHVALMNEPLSESKLHKKGTSKSKMFVPFTLRLSAGYGFGSVLNADQSKFSANQTNIDLSLEYSITPNWGIQTGLTYNLINETQSLNGLSVENNSYYTYADNSYLNYFDSEVILEDKTWWLGDWWVYGTYTDTILDSILITQIDSNLVAKFDSTNVTISENQKITQLEIPVLATYSFVHKRWVFQIATGASFGVYLNSKGKMVQLTDDVISGVNTSKDFFNSLQYNYLFSTEAGFAVNQQWRITARPQVKVNLNSMFNSGSEYSQKYIFYGLNVGVAYNFK